MTPTRTSAPAAATAAVQPADTTPAPTGPRAREAIPATLRPAAVTRTGPGPSDTAPAATRTDLGRPDRAPAAGAGALGGTAGRLAPLAAGVFVGVLAFDALPMAAGAVGGWAAAWALAGFLLIYMATRWAGSRRPGAAAWLATAGVWLHSVLEGVAAGAGGVVGGAAAVMLGAALIVHLVPESAALYAVLTRAGVATGQAIARCGLTWAWVAAGFVGAQLLMPGVPARPLGMAMGLAAGIFAYLAWLIWQQRSPETRHAWLWAAAGLAWVTILHL